MSYSQSKSVDFGLDRDLLTPIYTLYGVSGTVVSANVTGGIVNLGNGVYNTLLTTPDTFTGVLKWSSNELVDAVYAVEDINVSPFSATVTGSVTGSTSGTASSVPGDYYNRWTYSSGNPF